MHEAQQAVRADDAGTRGATRLVDALTLLVLPALFLNSGLFQLYPITGWVDPGMYLGYFFDLPGLLERYGIGATTYHGTRLSWILPGYWLHQALSPLAAQQVLVAVMYFVSIWAAFFAARELAGRAGGHLAAAFLAYNPLFLASVTFGAVDGAAIMYLLISAAFLTASARCDATWAWTAAFGAAACLAGIAHPFALLMAAIFYAAHAIAHFNGVRPALIQAAHALAGAVAAYVLVALVGKLYGFRFLFFMDSVAMVKGAFRGIGHNYRIPPGEWLFSSYRLLVPCFIMAAISAALPRMERVRNDAGVRAIAGALLASCAFFVCYDAALGGVTVQVRNYTSLTLPACALTLALIARIDDPKSWSNTRIISLHGVLAVPALAMGLSWSIDPGWLDSDSRQRGVFGLLCTVALAASAIVALSSVQTRRWRFAAALLVLLTSASSALNLDSANVFKARTGVELKEAYLGADSLSRALNASPWRDRQLLIWYDRAAFTTGDALADRKLVYLLRFGETRYRFSYYDTLSSLFLYDRSLLGDSFPFLAADALKPYLAPGARPVALVVISQKAGDLEQAISALKPLGVEARLRQTHTFDSPSFRHVAWILDLCPGALPGSPAGQCNLSASDMK